MRHPDFLGGAFWLYNMVYTQVSIFVILYVKSTLESSEEAALEAAI